MKYYRAYMDRQRLSAGAHARLMDLPTPRRSSGRSRAGLGALAACAALLLGLGLWRLTPGTVIAPGPDDGPRIPVQTSVPTQPGALGTNRTDDPPAAQVQRPSDAQGFLVSGSAQRGKLMLPMIPGINYPDVTDVPEVDACWAYAPGAFTVELGKTEIQTIFWGPAGKPEADHPKTEQGDLPWMLFWDGYTLRGAADYDGQGRLTQLRLYGEKDRASFTLELCPGAMPSACVLYADPNRTRSEFHGVEVAGWSRVYDRDGEGLADYICGSEFMTENNIGVRFENRNSDVWAEYEGGTSGANMALDGACTFNALFVRQALTADGGLHLDHLLTAEFVPEWRDERFDSLELARAEGDFAAYLPTAEPEGYSVYAGNKDFSARLSYQAGQYNQLFVRWSCGYDNVEVCVRLPEGDSTAGYAPVDISVPESYDTRIYELPWCDSVPEEYRWAFSSVTFRAEDMSPEVVEARETSHDTGGVRFCFNVLHPNGVVVSYSCDGLSARQVWAMVVATLP